MPSSRAWSSHSSVGPPGRRRCRPHSAPARPTPSSREPGGSIGTALSCLLRGRALRRARERFEDSTLECGNELFALGHQASLRHGARVEPKLYRLHECDVLLGDLRIELDDLLDPFLGQLEAEEVIRYLDRLPQVDRDPAFDGQVERAGSNVDGRVGPDEVVLRVRKLSARVVAVPARAGEDGFAHRPDLARDETLDRESIRIRIDVDHLAEARMRQTGQW